MSRDYIPRNDAQFLQWLTVFLKYLTTVATRLGFPSDVIQQLTAELNDFAQKFQVAEDPSTRTKLTIQAKTTARKALEKHVRQVVQEYLAHNHNVTDEDRDGLGITVPKTTRTPAQIAKTYPFFRIDSSIIRFLIIYFGSQNGDSKAKPPGQHGVEIRWAILENPPASINELVNSAFDTHTPFNLEFDENQRGKVVYFCLCWENTRGQKGPWSEIVSAIVP